MTFVIPSSLNYPPTLLIEGGARRQLGQALAEHAARKPLIVTDATMQKLGVLDDIASIVKDAGLEPASVLVDDRQEPTDLSIKPVTEALKQHGADAVIALGGGSVIDSTKAAVLLYAHGGSIRDYAYPADIPRTPMQVYAVPTTAGTGSEVTAATVITETSSGEKLLLMGPALIPDGAVVDYELSMTQPKRLTADTGLDALTHAIEAFVSRKATDDTDRVALEAMGLIFRNIRSAYFQGDDEGRRNMMRGATLAGIAFSNASVALVHGMSRPIGARFHVPHGLSNAMLLPGVTAFSLNAAEDRYARCAEALGIAGEQPASGGQLAQMLVKALEDLVADLEVPTLEAFGIERGSFFESLEGMASQALASGSPGNNPRIPTENEMATLYGLIYDRAPLDEILAL